MRWYTQGSSCHCRCTTIVIVLRKLNIVGTVVGTLKDAEEALDFTARGLVHPIFKKGTLANLDSFCELIQTGNWLDERSSRLLFDNQALLSRSGSLYWLQEEPASRDCKCN